MPVRRPQILGPERRGVAARDAGSIWRSGRLPLRLTQRQWRALLQWFVRESLGLRTSHRLAWADVVSDKDTAQIARLFRERKIERSDIQWSGAQRYVGVVHGGQLYRLAPSGGGATARF